MNELNQQTRSDFVLAVDKNMNVKIAKPLQEQYTIQLFDGLINPLTGDTSLNISRTTSESGLLGIGLRTSAKLTNNDKGSADPFYTMMSSSYYYYGNAYFSQTGALEKTEKYDNLYYKEAKAYINQYETKDNNAISYFKQPVPICWSTPTTTLANSATVNLEYLIKPFTFCVMKKYAPSMETFEYDEEGSPILGTGRITDYDEQISVLGNNTKDDLTKPSSFSIVDGYNIDTTDDEPFVNMEHYTGVSSYSIDYAIIEDKDILGWTQGIVPTSTEGSYTRYIYSPAEGEDNAQSLLNHVLSRLGSTNEFSPTIIPPLKALTASEIPEKYDNEGNLIQSGVTEYPCAFVLQYDRAKERWNASPKANYINLADWIGYDAGVTKIQISTNMPDNRTFTFFDANVAPWNEPEKLTTKTTTVRDGNLSAYVVSDTSTDAIRVYGLTNSNLFTNLASTPYYMILTTVANGVEEEMTIKLDDFISCDSPLIQKRGEHYILPNLATANDEYIAGVLIYETKLRTPSNVEGGSTTPSPEDSCYLIKITEFLSKYCKRANNNILWKVDVSKFDNIASSEVEDGNSSTGLKGYAFVLAKTITEAIESNEKVYDTDKNFITVEYEVPSNYHAGVSLKKPEGIDYVPETYRVRVVCNGHADVEWWSSISNLPIANRPIWTDVTYMKQEYDETEGWVDTGVWTSAWDLLAGGEITINEIPIESTRIDTKPFTFKKTHSAGPGYFVPDSIMKTVVIPDHATSVFLEVHQLSNNPISIYSTMEKMTSSTKLEPYSFPFNITSSTSLPTLTRNATILPTDKILYHKSSNGVSVIEVPLYRTKLDNSKAFNLKLVNVPSGNTNDRFLIRLIGYRA